ncbi:kinase-like domain-containing protein [Rhizophagus diaphanus]|nr:kinase-like domain-containing protein [Rhizophagus diaphanus] [Rhizophagus sp. MUCL 43196]
MDINPKTMICQLRDRDPGLINEYGYMANSHKHIIQFCGLTKSQGEQKYSLVLEYADGETLRDYLRNGTITFEWKDELKFAKDIASMILWLYDDRKIVHGDLHPNNILVLQNTFKLPDFGALFEKEKGPFRPARYSIISFP